jgi:hypothetical protein
LRFEVGLISGHSYRFQVIAHDGDQTRGGDSGEACAVFCAGTGAPTCPAGTAACGTNGTGCASSDFCGEDGCCHPMGSSAGDGGIIIK